MVAVIGQVVGIDSRDVGNARIARLESCKIAHQQDELAGAKLVIPEREV